VGRLSREGKSIKNNKGGIMNTKKEVKQKQTKSAIDYRKHYINYLSAQIQDLLKELREINDMPEKLIREKVVEERYRWMEIEGKNRELSNNILGEKK